MSFVAEGSGKLEFGLRAKLKGSAYGAKASADINIMSVELASGNVDLTDPLNADSYSGDYIGRDGAKASHGVGVSAGAGPVTVGWKAEHTSRLNWGYSEDDKDKVGFYVDVTKPILKNPNAKQIEQRRQDAGLPTPIAQGRDPEAKARTGKQGSFYGLDLGAGAQLFLGIDVNLKLGVKVDE
jgi:hypothetical protein